MQYRTYRELRDDFNENIRPQIDSDDEPALNEAWNNYTDAECKDGNLNNLLYHYCPALDSDDWPDDAEETLEYLMQCDRITIDVYEVSERPDNFFDDIAGSRHFQFTIHDGGRNGQTVYTGYYSQGPGITGRPSEVDIFAAVLKDCDNADQDFEDWADDLGFDSDSRKAEKIWRQCVKTRDALDGAVSCTLEEWIEIAHEI